MTEAEQAVLCALAGHPLEEPYQDDEGRTPRAARAGSTWMSRSLITTEEPDHF